MDYVNTIVQGALLGGLYALYAAGLSLIFGVMRLINLAHGDLIVLAAFVLLSMSTALGLPLPIALLILIPVAFVAGWALQRFLLNRTLGDDILLPLLVTFGLQILIQNGLLLAYSADSRKLSLGAIETSSINVFGLTLGLIPVITFLVAVIVLGVLSYVFYGTQLGRRLRATSDSTEVVKLMGVDPRNVFAMAMGMSFIVLVIAAFFMGVRANFDPSAGPARLLYAFEAVVIGGLGSLWGTLIGGIIVGIAQAIGAQINPQWQILAGHLVFLVFLLLRPRGLFPKQ